MPRLAKLTEQQGELLHADYERFQILGTNKDKSPQFHRRMVILTNKYLITAELLKKETKEAVATAAKIKKDAKVLIQQIVSTAPQEKYIQTTLTSTESPNPMPTYLDITTIQDNNLTSGTLVNVEIPKTSTGREIKKPRRFE